MNKWFEFSWKRCQSLSSVLALVGVSMSLSILANPLELLAAEPAFSVTISAIDSDTKKPLKSLRVTPTTFRENARAVTWQSQYQKKYDSLPATYTMDRGWQSTLLRIEADGYMPIVSEPLAKKTGLELNVVLQPHPGYSATVLTPDGKPAKNASVAMCTWTKEVNVKNGKIRYGHHAERTGGMAHTNAEGNFHLPPEVDVWVLVIAHESGYVEMTKEEFAKVEKVQLLKWGRIEGTFALAGKPMPEQTINIGAGRGDVEVVLHYETDKVTTDVEGKFVAETIPPVRLYVKPTFKIGDQSLDLLMFSGVMKIKPGVTSKADLPTIGADVVGKLHIAGEDAPDFQELELDVSVILRQPRISRFQPGVPDPRHSGYAILMQSEEGKVFRISSR
jgi:hypothetical protein